MKFNRSVDRYRQMPPRREWIDAFFSDAENFLTNHSLGSSVIISFKAFLVDAGLIKKCSRVYTISPAYTLLCNFGLHNPTTWAIMIEPRDR